MCERYSARDLLFRLFVGELVLRIGDRGVAASIAVLDVTFYTMVD